MDEDISEDFQSNKFQLDMAALEKKTPCVSKKSLEIFSGTFSGVKTLCSKRTSCVALRRENSFSNELVGLRLEERKQKLCQGV